jgi:hypothetical protein
VEVERGRLEEPHLLAGMVGMDLRRQFQALL